MALVQKTVSSHPVDGRYGSAEPSRMRALLEQGGRNAGKTGDTAGLRFANNRTRRGSLDGYVAVAIARPAEIAATLVTAALAAALAATALVAAALAAALPAALPAALAATLAATAGTVVSHFRPPKAMNTTKAITPSAPILMDQVK